MTDDELNEAQALCDAATPGPWKHGSWQYDSQPAFHYTEITPSRPDDISITVETTTPPPSVYENGIVVGGCGCCGSPFGRAEDGRFIAAARELVPRLLNEVRACQDEIDALRSELSNAKEANNALFRLEDAIRNVSEAVLGIRDDYQDPFVILGDLQVKLGAP